MKKIKIIVLLIVGLGLFSCSSDKNESDPKSAIVGTWNLTAINIDESTASDDAKNIKTALAILTGKDCYVLTFTFNQDLSVKTENSVNYLDISYDPDTGLSIPCPDTKDIDDSTYTFDGKVLTYIDTDEQVVTVNVTISGKVMTINATDLNIPNFNEEGELVFTKQ